MQILWALIKPSSERKIKRNQHHSIDGTPLYLPRNEPHAAGGGERGLLKVAGGLRAPDLAGLGLSLRIDDKLDDDPS